MLKSTTLKQKIGMEYSLKLNYHLLQLLSVNGSMEV